MAPLAFALGVFTLLAVTPVAEIAADRFDQKLSKDQQIIHALNRLTFGARPGDVEHVRRIGVEKWIDLQLHPERIPENAALSEKLQPLQTVQMASPQLFETYQPRPGSFGVFVQKAQVQVQVRVQSPMRMNTLLTRQQQQTLLRGTPEEKMALLQSFDDQKRREIAAALPPDALADIPELRRISMAARQGPQFVNSELMEHKVYRAIYSNRQLEEVLVDFWFNHFNVFNGKGPGRILLTSYERDAIRPFVFGRFKDMLVATARHPAMLFYLDNWQSQAPNDQVPTNAPFRGRRSPGLNENYGRELLELHTLGVDGGYTQQDVIAVARAFTGWTIREPNRIAEFLFNPQMHDSKEKIVLGHTIPAGGGEADGLKVLDIVANHPSTARFISKKLAQRFVSDDPPQALVDRMAATFTKTGGDLRAVLQTMFKSNQFFSSGAWQAKLKSPLEFVISAVRAIDADATDTFILARKISELGQPLYGKAEPTGYSNTGEGWTNTAGLLGRINLASALVEGRVPGVQPASLTFQGKPAVFARQLLGAPPSKEVLSAIETGLPNTQPTPAMIASMIFASPDFQRR
jgi:uncharacterized protein (DUF1800 family)